MGTDMHVHVDIFYTHARMRVIYRFMRLIRFYVWVVKKSSRKRLGKT